MVSLGNWQRTTDHSRDAEFRNEYCRLITNPGMISLEKQEEYVSMRRVDAGLEVLMPSVVAEKLRRRSH